MANRAIWSPHKDIGSPHQKYLLLIEEISLMYTVFLCITIVTSGRCTPRGPGRSRTCGQCCNINSSDGRNDRDSPWSIPILKGKKERAALAITQGRFQFTTPALGPNRPSTNLPYHHKDQTTPVAAATWALVPPLHLDYAASVVASQPQQPCPDPQPGSPVCVAHAISRLFLAPSSFSEEVSDG